MNFHQKRINDLSKQLKDLNQVLSGVSNDADPDILSVDQIIALEDRKKLTERINRESNAFGVKNPLQMIENQLQTAQNPVNNTPITQGHP